jgi:hypothetical protein
MDYSTRIVALLIERPHWSNSALARLVGCEQRRVRRYRRRLAECRAPLAEVESMDAISVRTLLNERPSKPLPNFVELRAAHPYSTGRGLWRAYVDQHPVDEGAPISYSHFMRRLEESSL